MKPKRFEPKLPLAAKCSVYLEREAGASYSALSFKWHTPAGSLQGVYHRIRRQRSEAEDLLSFMSPPDRARAKCIASCIAEKTLSLEESAALAKSYGQEKLDLMYIAYRTGLMGEVKRPDSSCEMPQGRKKKLSSKDITDEKDLQIYWLTLENEYLKKKIEIRERMRRESQFGETKSEP